MESVEKKPKKKIQMKIFQKGQVVIPVALRKKYRINIGDHVEVIPTSTGILLKPGKKQPDGASKTEGLFGIFGDYAAKKPSPGKEDMARAVEKGFIEGWRE